MVDYLLLQFKYFGRAYYDVIRNVWQQYGSMLPSMLLSRWYRTEILKLINHM